MALRLKPNKPLRQRTKRIIRSEIDASLQLIPSNCVKALHLSPSAVDENIHGLRKHLKTIRAVLQLVRSSLGRKAYARALAHIRKTARPLSDLRDAQVLIETLDTLTSSSSNELSARACADFREFLESRKQNAGDQFTASRLGCQTVRRTLKQSRESLRHWKCKRLNWSGLRRGLKHTYAAGARAYVIASAQQTPEHLHEWRKQVKGLWYQLQVLHPVWEQIRDELGSQLNLLAKILGQDHDLALLHQVVKIEAIAAGRDAELEDLTVVIEERRSQLERDAFELGRDVYKLRPKVLLQLIEQWWKA